MVEYTGSIPTVRRFKSLVVKHPPGYMFGGERRTGYMDVRDFEAFRKGPSSPFREVSSG